jgi:phage tail protein X
MPPDMRDVTAWGHLLPVVVRKTRQLDTQKPPVTERNVTPTEVTPKAAEPGLAEKGQQLQVHSACVHPDPHAQRRENLKSVMAAEPYELLQED